MKKSTYSSCQVALLHYTLFNVNIFSQTTIGLEGFQSKWSIWNSGNSNSIRTNSKYSIDLQDNTKVHLQKKVVIE